MPSDYLIILFLIINGYDIPDYFIINLNKLVDPIIPTDLSNLSYSDIEKASFESKLQRLLKLLIDEKKIPDFKELLEKFENNIAKASSKISEP